MPRPRAGDWLEDELRSWLRDGVTFVVSLLEHDEVMELDLTREPELARQFGIEFMSFPIPDRGIPASTELFRSLVQVIAEKLSAGAGVGIHCRMGIGRSASVAVCALAALGVSTGSSWQAIARSRKMVVPDTPQQREWVNQWCSLHFPQ